MTGKFGGDSRQFPTLDVVSAATGIAVNPDDIMGFHGVLAVAPAVDPPWRRGNALVDLAAMMRPGQFAVAVVFPDRKE